MYPYCMNFNDRSDIVYQAEEKELESSQTTPRRGHMPSGGGRPPGEGHNQPDHGHRPPDHGRRPPDHGRRPPDRVNPSEPWGRPASYPPGEPPAGIPERPIVARGAVFAVDPGAFIGCMNRYTYIWLRNGVSFWMYITFIGRQSVSGYRWTRFGWTYTGLSLQTIEMFRC